MINALLFDFDGTIIDSLVPTIKAYNRVATRQKLPLVLDNVYKNLRNETNPHVLFSKLKIRKYRLPFLVRSIRNELYKEIDTLQITDGIVETMKKLSKEYEIYIVSSNTEKFIKAFLKLPEGQKIAKYIKKIFCYPSVLGKARLLKRVLKQIKLQANQTLYIGDEIRDINACTELNIPIISVTWGYNSKKILKQYNDHVVDSPNEIKSKIDHINDSNR